MQSLGENKNDGYRPENRLFPQMKTSKKSTFIYIDLYTLILLCTAMVVCYQLFITFMSRYCL